MAESHVSYSLTFVFFPLSSMCSDMEKVFGLLGLQLRVVFYLNSDVALDKYIDRAWGNIYDARVALSDKYIFGLVTGSVARTGGFHT